MWARDALGFIRKLLEFHKKDFTEEWTMSFHMDFSGPLYNLKLTETDTFHDQLRGIEKQMNKENEIEEATVFLDKDDLKFKVKFCRDEMADVTENKDENVIKEDAAEVDVD